MKRWVKILIVSIISLLSVLAMFIIMDRPNMEGVNGIHLERVIINFSKSLPELNISHFFVFIFVFYFYYQFYFKDEKIKKSISALSIFLATMLVLGYSFHKTNSWDLVFKGEVQIIKSLIKIFGYYFIIYILIKKLFDGIKYLGNKKFNENKYLSFIFTKHPNLLIILILLILWLPIIIMFFPSVQHWDGTVQIGQLIGKQEEAEYYCNVINPNVTINNHHPILSTLIIGLFINIGKFLNSADIGLYLYALSQMAFLLYIIIYSFKIMRKMNIPNQIQLCVLIFYATCPMFYIFGMNMVKDVPFSMSVFYYVLLLIEMMVDNNVLKRKRYILKVSVVLFLVMMFRNNGIYTILLSFPFLIILFKSCRKQLLIALAIPIILYIGLNKVVYPILEISSGSIREALSIPFQQTARTLHENKKYEEQDIEKINKILDVEKMIKKYNPNLSDPVKDSFNKKYHKEDLMNYFKVWGKYLFRYPTTYIEATLNNSYGYIYPNKANVVGYFNIYKNDFIRDNPLNMKHMEDFREVRENLEKVYQIGMKTPVIGTILSVGFYSFMLLILTLNVLLSKEKKYFIVHLALLSILLVCIASPYLAMRYMLSVVYSLPILIMLSIYIERKRNVERNEGKR